MTAFATRRGPFAVAALATIAVAALGLAACGGPQNDKAATTKRSAATKGAPARRTPRPANARQYVALASGSDLFEMQSARIALEKAESAEVSGLAQMILADHQRSSSQLGQAAAQAQPPLTPAPALSPGQQQSLAALQRAQRDDFDRLWLRQQVLAHQSALDVAVAYARGGDSEPLRRHAAATIAAIQTHLARARRLGAEAQAQPKQ